MIDVPLPALRTADDENGTSVALNSWGGSVPQTTPSTVSTKQKRSLTNATLVIEVRPGMPPLSALADYAALVTLAEIQPDAAHPGSILDLFAAPQRHPALSDLDDGFLTALYRVTMDRLGKRQRQTIVGEMARAAERSPPAE